MAKSLFILGHARSGTTVVADLLNSSPDVLLLYEAHMFEPHWPAQFVSNFNLHHRQAAVFKSKGKFLPSGLAGLEPEKVLENLGQHYAWIGEKVAIGPLSGRGAGAAVAAVDYYLSHHMQAHCIFTFRAPLPSLASLKRVFPGVALVSLLHGWMLSLIELASAAHLFEKSILLPIEFLTMDSWTLVQEKLGIAGRAEASWLGSHGGALAEEAEAALIGELAGQLGWDLDRTGAYVRRLSAIYADFLLCIDPATLNYQSHTSFVARVGDQLLTEIHQLAAELRVVASSAVPASVCAWSEEGQLVESRMANPSPGATFARYGRILRDRLFSSNYEMVLMSHPSSTLRLEADGIAMTREGDRLHLVALASSGQHKHLTVPVPIEPLRVATTRFLVRREQSSRYLMVQSGDAAGFHNCLVDLEELRIVNILSFGTVRNIFAQAELLADGQVRVLLSGILSSGSGSYVRIYLCSPDGALEPVDATASASIGDLVLSYGYQDCGIDDVL